jgi:hypothetical protein
MENVKFSYASAQHIQQIMLVRLGAIVPPLLRPNGRYRSICTCYSPASYSFDFLLACRFKGY